MEDAKTKRIMQAPAFDSVDPWYVVHCKSGKERYAAGILHSDLGLSVYLPEKKIWSRGNIHTMPLFPGYFFVQADLRQTAPGQINTSPAILRLLGFDGSPQMLPANFVEALDTQLTRLNEYSSIPLRPGDTVHVIDGPLRGLEAVFLGPATPSTRVQVLLTFLGRLTKAEVERSMLEKRIEPVKLQQTSGRPRYTRGKGRKIYYQEGKNSA